MDEHSLQQRTIVRELVEADSDLLGVVQVPGLSNVRLEAELPASAFIAVPVPGSAACRPNALSEAIKRGDGHASCATSGCVVPSVLFELGTEFYEHKFVKKHRGHALPPSSRAVFAKLSRHGFVGTPCRFMVSWPGSKRPVLPATRTAECQPAGHLAQPAPAQHLSWKVACGQARW